ncbi:MAG: epimerase [Cytophagales bacterium CG12_big_fil_rev_8_21_14_0_65_40_12]|nr:MAG: epimerase [Cytophagales bacterium CG12_big_fil_rev_8_21_14_0_65_40_12]PIW04131.1 MAG: epimerase [Cytophagales bacterium CG17_big_fil_post_rev_8_21_14_2_50_40_13]
MKISIVGCGWLGLALGAALVKSGHQILGSTTSTEKLEKLRQAGIAPYLLKLEPMPTGENFNQLFQTDLLVINIPPGRKTNTPEFYEEQIKYLRYLIDQHQVPKVIFVSSTSYYPNTNQMVDERFLYDLENGSNRAVVQAEKQIKQSSSDIILLRCGGLMGEERIPGQWFAGKETTGAETPVNYIHRDDVIAVIQFLIEKKASNTTLNLVCPDHPNRKEVHEAMALKYGFQNPIWIEPNQTTSKIVSSEKLVRLGYQFKYPSPTEF